MSEGENPQQASKETSHTETPSRAGRPTSLKDSLRVLKSRHLKKTVESQVRNLRSVINGAFSEANHALLTLVLMLIGLSLCILIYRM